MVYGGFFISQAQVMVDEWEYYSLVVALIRIGLISLAYRKRQSVGKH
jgi:hypothetical protein